jgi:hypothetical protein
MTKFENLKMRALQTIMMLLLFAPMAFAQKAFQDYIVSKTGDTVYGVIRAAVMEDLALFETVIRDGKPTFFEHTLRGVKAIRRNDKVFYPRAVADDPIYGGESEKADASTVLTRFGKYVSRSPRLRDYVVTSAGDTVFGEIKGHTLIAGSGKFKLDPSRIKAYRTGNRVFELKENIRAGFVNDRRAFVERLLDGKLALYKFTSVGNASIHLDQPTDYYYIEKNGQLTAIDDWPALEALVADKPKLVEKIKSGEYGHDNLYLIVKYYNAAP